MVLIKDAINMIRDIRGTGNSKAIRIWGPLLNVTQLLGGLVFIMQIEGQVVLMTLILTLVVAGQIHKNTPYSRLTGLCHLPWLALLPWLIYRLLTVEHTIYFQVWGYFVVILIEISLVFDVMDVYRYIRGQKIFSWSVR
jgi:hypothetical protein